MQRVALVTGGNRGIGLEICRGMARAGYLTLMGCRSLEKGMDAAQALRADGDVKPFVLDTTSAESVNDAKIHIERIYGRIDALINNAAILIDDDIRILDVDIDVFHQTLETNVVGPLMLCQALMPMMIKQNYGRVVNVSSEMGQVSAPVGDTAASYSVSKAALNSLTRALAWTVRRYNIKVNAVDPGWVRTDMGGPSASRSPEQGADTAIWLATLPDNGPTDGFFLDRQPTPW